MMNASLDRCVSLIHSHAVPSARAGTPPEMRWAVAISR